MSLDLQYRWISVYERNFYTLREQDGSSHFYTILIFFKKRALYKYTGRLQYSIQISKLNFKDFSLLNGRLKLNTPYLKRRRWSDG